MEQDMIVLTEEAARNRVAPLFANWEETLIWTALEGMMGQIMVLDEAKTEPKAAVCQTGDFVFLAGDASSPEAEQLLWAMKEKLQGRFAILTPQNESWEVLIQRVFGQEAKAGERYAICKDASVFDRERLCKLAKTLPQGVSLQLIRGDLYDMTLSLDWSRDFCSQFESKEDYAQRGLGIVALHNGALIGGASSYIRYREGIEIEVQTRSDWRRKGIASACCAQLILNCLDAGLYPSWDAANRESVALAEKLGYQEKGKYPVWFING
ncbi:MAG: GNAT family N-acetyltransferase [Clostridia bacterium]|nr:GNAT family N-acetyltransferase [Clostridia bacterium]